MLKFSRKHNTQSYPDGSLDYIIDLEEGDTPIRTVQEFIDLVLVQYPNEWGDIVIKKPVGRWTNYLDCADVICSYFSGNLLTTLPPEYLSKEIVEVKASGGHTNINYFIVTY